MAIEYPSSPNVAASRNSDDIILADGRRVEIRDMAEKVYYWTVVLTPDQQNCRLLLNDGYRTSETNWFWGLVLGDPVESFVLLHVDATVITGRDHPQLVELLSRLRLNLTVNQLVVFDRALSDIAALDPVLEARIAALEQFVNEFLKLDQPAAEALRMLGAKPFDRTHDYRRLLKPMLFTRNHELCVFLDGKNIQLDHEISIQVRLRGIEKRPLR